jgi:periplasmic divalent cation tolerance protein
MMEQIMLVLTNVPDMPCAEKMAHHLVEHKLAACINCLPGVKSIYRWQGAVEEAAEVTLMIKTTSSAYPELEAAIKSQHPYDLPEIIALPVAFGWMPYMDWIVKETKKDCDV